VDQPELYKQSEKYRQDLCQYAMVGDNDRIAVQQLPEAVQHHALCNNMTHRDGFFVCGGYWGPARDLVVAAATPSVHTRATTKSLAGPQ